MKIKDRLKTAYENVAVDGDKTWTDSNHDALRKANQRLYAKEYQINNIKIIEERPRTVKDIIPQSKLAKYGDYEYNEARELCYTRSLERKPRFEFFSKEYKNPCGESWLLSEVDYLFIWFLHCKNQTRLDYGPFETCDENGEKKMLPAGKDDCSDVIDDDDNIDVVSPFLSASGFKEKKLKMCIVSDKIKLLWTGSSKPALQESACRSLVVLACGSTKQEYDLLESARAPIRPAISAIPELAQAHTSRVLCDKEFLDAVSEPTVSSESFDHLKNLPLSFKKQNTWFSKKPQRYVDEPTPPQLRLCDDEKKTIQATLSSRRLYSAVLQGLNNADGGKKQEERASAEPKEETITLPVPNYATSPSTAKQGVAYAPTETPLSPKKVTSTHPDSEKNQKSIQANLKIATKPKPFEICNKPHLHLEESLRTVNQVSYPFLSAPPSYSYNVSSYAHFNYSAFHQNCACASSFSITNRNVFQRHQTFLPTNHPHNQYQYTAPPTLLMLQQSRTTIYPATVQSPYYLQPMQQQQHARLAAQRWILPQNYHRSFNHAAMQPQFMSTPWFNSQLANVQNFSDGRLRHAPVKPKRVQTPQISILRKMHESDETTTDSELVKRPLWTHSNSSPEARLSRKRHATKTKPLPKNYFDELVSKTMNFLFDDETHVPVTSTLSEELEIQALEQYCSSSDNVYQDLERQAAEQYDASFSENWNGPPRLDDVFGGPTTPCCFSCCLIDVHV